MSLYKYDGAGNLIQQVNYNTNGTILDSFSYVYDNKGRITSVTSSAGTTSYVYDALDQLAKETHADGTVYDYTYDEVGNRLTMTVTPSGGSATTTTHHYDNANEISDVNGTSYTYDANGNLTNDGNQTYVYDNGDRLTAVKDKNDNTVASFTYDSSGLRKTMTTSAGTTTFHYDENNNVAYETDSSNNVVASYTWNGNEPVSMTRGGQTYYYQLNGHGDVVALTDSTGAVVNTYDYDAFGNLLHQTGTVVNPYLYAGYWYDKETGLYYLQARYYDAKTGRFLTLDPSAGDDNNPLTQNGYSYCENNPVMKIDSNGNMSWILAGELVGLDIPGVDVIDAAYLGYRAYRTYRAVSSAYNVIETIHSLRRRHHFVHGVHHASRHHVHYAKRNIKLVNDKYLKRKGFNAHQIKNDLVGGNIAEYDIYVDKDTGELLIYRKGGVGEPIETYEYIKNR